MKRPSRLEILEYALDGVRAYYGTYSGQFSDDEEAELDDHIEWLKAEIVRVRQRQGVTE